MGELSPFQRRSYLRDEIPRPTIPYYQILFLVLPHVCEALLPKETRSWKRTVELTEKLFARRDTIYSHIFLVLRTRVWHFKPKKLVGKTWMGEVKRFKRRSRLRVRFECNREWYDLRNLLIKTISIQTRLCAYRHTFYTSGRHKHVEGVQRW